MFVLMTWGLMKIRLPDSYQMDFVVYLTGLTALAASPGGWKYVGIVGALSFVFWFLFALLGANLR